LFPLWDSEKSESRPVVTICLIVVNVLAFFYQISLDGFSLHQFLMHFGTVPRDFEFLDLLTSMFLHGGWMHLLGNMWFLWVFGDNIEDILGRWNYLGFYLLCGAAGGILHVWSAPNSPLPAIGASGAISGVMGAYLVKFPKSRIHTLLFFIIFVTTIEVPAILMIGYWFAVQLFSGFGSLAQASAAKGGGTAWFAHVGGFVAGVVLIKLLPARARWSIRKEYGW
jgi:membrane associated rhomboid family serine protease